MVGTFDQAGPPFPAIDPPRLAWRLLSPIGAVLLAFLVVFTAAGMLSAAGLSEDALGAVLAFGSSLLLLVFGYLLWRGLPAHERRAALARKRGRRGALGMGLVLGIGLIIGSGAVIVAGSAIDPAVERRLEEVEEIGTAPWQLVLTVLALVALAPVGEELLFRGLLLRALVRRISFWPAALACGLLFAAAHLDAYLIWPRAIALAITGVVLAWLYRRRGYWASVTAHATVNAVASAALIAASLE